MPIVSAAVIAVGAAIASTTLATVATAAVAVGTLVGTVGLGMSVVGMAIGNKTLTKVGGYLGMAGGVMSVAGGLAGGMAGYAKTLSSAWDDGVGSMFSSTKSVGQAGLQQEALGRGIVAGTNKDAMSYYQATGQPLSQQGVTAGVASNTATPPTGITPGGPDKFTGVSDFRATGQLSSGVNPPGVSQTVTPGDMSQFANAAPTSAPQATTNLSAVTTQANAAPTAGGTIPKMGLEQWPTYTNPSIGGGTSGVQGFWQGLPDWAKAQVAISGAQGLAGMAGGWFESASAEERLELERQAQAWRQQHEDKTQAFNQKNASYAPTVQFGDGTLSRGA